MKKIQEKLDAKIMAHTKMTEELNKRKEEIGRAQGIITTLQEATQKKHQWYKEQIKMQQNT